MRFLLALAALAALTASAAAQANLGPDEIQPGTYVIDRNETLVRYGTIHMDSTNSGARFPTQPAR